MSLLQNRKNERTPFQDYQRRQVQAKWLGRAVWGLFWIGLVSIAFGGAGA